MTKVEMHYYLEGGIHSMDAFVKNKAEGEMLKIFKEVSDLLNLDLDFELEALKEGGIKEFFKVLNKKKNKKKIKSVLLTALGVILTGVITNLISNRLDGDAEFDQLKKEKIKLEIEKLKKELNEDAEPNTKTIEIENLIIAISNTDKIRLYKSNFYSALLKEPKIEKFSTQEVDDNYESITKELIVERTNFDKFFVDKALVDIEKKSEVNIEIVSPVLKTGNMKWRGIYDSQFISFNMLDSEFKQSILNREITFANGISIKCDIVLEKTMNENGELKLSNVNVFNVVNVFQGELTIETKRSKNNKLLKNQKTIDFDDLKE